MTQILSHKKKRKEKKNMRKRKLLLPTKSSDEIESEQKKNPLSSALDLPTVVCLKRMRWQNSAGL
jgi:hypothetical protein